MVVEIHYVGSGFWCDFWVIRHSIVASIPACHAGDRGSIPRVGGLFPFTPLLLSSIARFFSGLYFELGCN